MILQLELNSAKSHILHGPKKGANTSSVPCSHIGFPKVLNLSEHGPTALGTCSSIRLDEGEQSALGLGKFTAVVTALEQVPIDIEGHRDRGVPEPLLHHLRRQFEPAIDLPVDAPGSIEVSQGMEVIFRFPVGVGDSGL